MSLGETGGCLKGDENVNLPEKNGDLKSCITSSYSGHIENGVCVEEPDSKKLAEKERLEKELELKLQILQEEYEQEMQKLIEEYERRISEI